MRALLLVIVSLALTMTTTNAQIPNNALGECMAQQTTGAEREHFAKWIFSIMAQHPVAAPYSDISAAEREIIDKQTATLLTRLITNDCSSEARETYINGGDRAIINAFRAMGEIAMQELFRNRAVAESAENYYKYLDMDAFNRILR